MSEDKNKKKSFAEAEKHVLGHWLEEKVFERSLEKTKRGKPFVFFEGPPTANGQPGIHHVIGRAFKDVILRYKTMRGFWVWRRAGWDTHGLPVEIEVEKELGLKTKKDIERYGIEAFNQKCRESVWRYKKEWERLTKRMGFWIDMDDPYITYEARYIENLWAVIKKFWEKKLLEEDFKVLPWCARCGTVLSSHELAQGYERITEKSVIVKFQIKNPNGSKLKSSAKGGSASGGKSYLLAWTTTPWTLPGNVALAVNPKARYVTVEKDGEWYIIAKDRLSVLGEGYKEISEEKGEALAGLEYEPLFNVSKSEKLTDKSHSVVAGDFVSTEEGTGIVHIAPAFGADDQEVGKKNNLPILFTTGEDGKMKTPGYLWDGKYFKSVDPLIIQDLKERGLLFKEESYEHDYPFCWRCKEPLMYYARRSWFLRVSENKKELAQNNKKINWVPEHFKEGRFGEWIRDAKDWAFSRERYWGTPLPIWRCKECKHHEVIGSFEELDKLGSKRTTRVFVMRHGEADHNLQKLVGPATEEQDKNNNLTKKGVKQAETTAKKLKKEKIDLIISSPLTRAKETAKIVSKITGAEAEVNKNIFDINTGDLFGSKEIEIDKNYPFARYLSEPFPRGESLRDVRARMFAQLRKIVRENRSKNILIISHGDPLWVLNAALEGNEEKNYPKLWYPKTGEAKELKIHNWPYSRSGEIDPHRPYIDLIELECPKCSGVMSRVKELADVWFDSGSMPFAQSAPKNSPAKKLAEPTGGQFPADYIAEAVDQTRGWFYTLLTVSTLLGKGPSYKNVVVNGHVLDKDGKKMSKSRGNTVEPFQLFEKHGADAVRWYFYTVNQPWDEKLFKESDVADASRKFLNIFWNSFVYWQTYKDKSRIVKKKPKLLINKWLNARLNQVGFEVTESLEKYDIVKAARAVENFVAEDLSRWYIRRVRDAMRFGTVEEKKEITSVFGLALYETSKLASPFIPFLTDRMFLEVTGKGSIHLESWTKFKKPSASEKKMTDEMSEARRIVSLTLEARAKAGIKVRQPLSKLKIKNEKLKTIVKNSKLVELIRGEVNVKEIEFNAKIKDEVELDTTITPELKEEGQLRELIRHIQEKRKETGLQPSDKITFVALTDDKGVAFVKKFEPTLKKEAGIKTIAFKEFAKPSGLTIVLRFGI